MEELLVQELMVWFGRLLMLKSLSGCRGLSVRWEVRDVVFDCAMDGSPGLLGCLWLFFKIVGCWNFVKGNMVRVSAECFHKER